MAIWQFKLELIPSSWVESHDVALLFSEEGYNAASAWRGFKHVDLISRALGGVLPKGKSWHADQSLWGCEEATDIQLWKEGEEIESLVIRVDLRSPGLALFSAVVELARQYELSIVVVESQQCITSELNALLQAAASSRAALFVKSPIEYLAGIGEISS